MKKFSSKIGRRQFIASTAVASTAMMTGDLNASESDSPSGRIGVGVIGLGSRGYNLIDEVLNQRGAQIVAVCDVDSRHHRDRPWGQGTAYGTEPAVKKITSKDPSTRGLYVTKDYREICQHGDVDVVIVGTPDHWHATCTLEAIGAGKDVYCEKPVTHTFAEGQQVYRAAIEHQTVFQTGSQQRSDPKFRRAVELVRNGRLGKLRQVEVGLNPGYEVPQNDTTVIAPPDHLDYEWWCGPAPKLPYMRARHHRWWRGHRAYGGGVLMDWIGHHNDIAHWAMDLDGATDDAGKRVAGSGPTEVEAVGWKMPKTDVYNTPVDYEIRCRYANGVQSSISSGNRHGVTFRGDAGWVFVTRGKIEASNSDWLTDIDGAPSVGPVQVTRSNNHMGNFFDCVRERTACIATAEIGHRSITPGHLGYVSHQLGRALKWNAETETILNDDEANELLIRNPYRKFDHS